ncbi:hypothetical protein BJX63DRAFT_241235 [Aspergillus granulosus]|uniref:BZIP domain-containing protein n=1 Tax=Aspergillus granulosus TaxID=176169 RepID=A0ABR4HAZ8_9EURO
MSHLAYFPSFDPHEGTYTTGRFTSSSNSTGLELATPPDSPSNDGLRRSLHCRAGIDGAPSNCDGPYSSVGGTMYHSPSATYHTAATSSDESLLFPSSIASAASSPDPAAFPLAQLVKFEEDETLFPSSNEQINPTDKGAKRRSQNREAQRRFRERKEQERFQLMTRLRGLTQELGLTKQKVHALEAENERLVMELDLLRPWHQNFMSIMMAVPGLEPTPTTNSKMYESLKT